MPAQTPKDARMAARTRRNPGRGGDLAQRVQSTERTTRAIHLRAAGMTWEEVARAAGYNSPQAAYIAVRRALEAALEIQDEAAEVLRELEVMRLNTLQHALWDDALGGDQRAVDQVRKLIDQRCKLLGLYAPIKIDRGDTDAVNAEIENLVAQLNQMPTGVSDTHPG